MDFSLEKNPPPSVFTKVNDYPSDLSENCFWFWGFFVFASSHSLVTIGFLFSFKTITGWTFMEFMEWLRKLCFPWRNNVTGLVYVSSEVQTTTPRLRRSLANHFGNCSCIWRLLRWSTSGGSTVFTNTICCCAVRSVFTWYILQWGQLVLFGLIPRLFCLVLVQWPENWGV